MYKDRIKKILSPAERKVFAKLNTPQKIQDFLDKLPQNDGDSLMSPRRVLKGRAAHCIEGALFAAAALAYHGHPPLLLDLQSADPDEDHCVALFKHGGLWGAISKTSHPVLRYRDPVYKTVRELAMSYFHEYFLPSGRKTLLAVSSKPFDLSKYDPSEWITAEHDLFDIEGDFDWAPHVPLVPKRTALRLASAVERRAINILTKEEEARSKRIRKRA